MRIDAGGTCRVLVPLSRNCGRASRALSTVNPFLPIRARPRTPGSRSLGWRCWGGGGVRRSSASFFYHKPTQEKKGSIADKSPSFNPWRAARWRLPFHEPIRRALTRPWCRMFPNVPCVSVSVPSTPARRCSDGLLSAHIAARSWVRTAAAAWWTRAFTAGRGRASGARESALFLLLKKTRRYNNGL